MIALAPRQKLFAAMAAFAVPLAFLAVRTGGASPGGAGEVAACFQFVAFTALLLSPVTGRPATASRLALPTLKQICVLWLWISGLTHVTWELSWCLAHPYLHGVGPADSWAWFWWIYGVADHRFLASDSFVVAREWMAAAVEGPLNFYILYLLWKGRTLPATVGLFIVSTMELTGTTLYFAVEALNGFAHVDGGLVNFWVKFVLLTLLWIVFPALSLHTAARTLKERA